jgi:hypothetical protein
MLSSYIVANYKYKIFIVVVVGLETIFNLDRSSSYWAAANIFGSRSDVAF